MITQPKQRSPSLEIKRCSPKNLSCELDGKEEEIFSPPMLSCTSESAAENMNQGVSSGTPQDPTSDDTDMCQSSPSSASSSKPDSVNRKLQPGPTSKSPYAGQVFCGGYNGESHSSSAVPLEDVMRWKEFRRRQKEITEELHNGALPNLNSLSFSTALLSSERTAKEFYDLQKKSPKAVEIDQDGFPASPTDHNKNLTAENKRKMAPSMSDAPTEIASNMVISVNKLLTHTTAKDQLGSIRETHPSKTDQAPLAPSSSRGIIAGRKFPRDHLRINTAPTTPIASTPPSTRSLGSTMSIRSDTSARERFGDSNTKSSMENEWDDTKPTLDVNTLNESSIEEDKNNVSTVSSNWDPLHVSAIEDGDETEREYNERINLDSTNIHGDLNDSIMVNRTARTVQTSPKKVTSPCYAVPTLTEVMSFMNKMGSMREKPRIHNTNINKSKTMNARSGCELPQTQSPLSSQDFISDVDVKEENTEDTYLQFLMEKKEKLRLYKLDSQRKRNKLDEKLKAMRSKLRSPSIVNRSRDGESGNESMIVCDDVPMAKNETPESEAKDQSVRSNVSNFPGARWCGGRAIWGSLVSTPEENITGSNAVGEKESFAEHLPHAKSNTGNCATKPSLSPSPTNHKECTTTTDKNQGNNSYHQVLAHTSNSITSSSRQYENTASIRVKDNFSSELALQIPFSPLVVGEKSSSKFSFSALEVRQTSTNIPASESLLEATSNTPSNTSDPMPHLSATSPDVSEGDKGGGLGFGYTGDKSVISKSSSKLVELGEYDTSLKEPNGDKERCLVGVTVVGSKEKKQATKKKLDSSPATDKENRGNDKDIASSPKIVAPDPPGVEPCDVRNDSASKLPRKRNKSLTVDCSHAPLKQSTKEVNAEIRNTAVKDAPARQPSLSIEPPPISPVVESTTSDNEFEVMIQKAKTIKNTPRNTPKSCLDTPRAANTASLKSPRFRMERDSKISALKMKFESEGLVSPKINPPDRSFSWTKSKPLSNSNQIGTERTKISGFYEQSKSMFGSNPMITTTLSDVKEELTQVDSMDNSSMSSFKGLNIKELRSRFDNCDTFSLSSFKKNSTLKSAELASKSSIESDINGNDCSDKMKTLYTSKVPSYTNRFENKISEQSAQDRHPEVAKTNESGSGELLTELSAKENILEQTADGMFPNFSPVAMRKKAFEMRRQKSASKARTPNNIGGNAQHDILACQSINMASQVQPIGSSIAQISTPRLSVKERIAAFNSPDTFNSTQVKNSRQMIPFQKLTPPPGSIQMNNKLL
jgi:hypothetical protein